ncbi:MAG: acetyl-CoA carboxylase biotin carboxyl carrier protein [Planctomycetota bacterium]
MDLKLIRNLVRIMERGEVDEIEIDDEKAGLRVHLRRGAGPGAGSPQIVMMPGGAYGAPPALPLAGAPGLGGDGLDSGSSGARPKGVEEITSPMIGTFYRAPAPDAENFANVGTRVEDESVVCIIEAMKVMNEIKAECVGEIVEVLVENGEPVEYGQPLFLVKSR